MSIELKSCPFCGYDLRKDDFFECISVTERPLTGNIDYRVKCPSCDSCGGNHSLEEQAVFAWNRRKEVKEKILRPS